MLIQANYNDIHKKIRIVYGEKTASFTKFLSSVLKVYFFNILRIVLVYIEVYLCVLKILNLNHDYIRLETQKHELYTIVSGIISIKLKSNRITYFP